MSQDLGPGLQLVIPDALAFFAQQGAARAVLATAASGGGSVRAFVTNLPAKAVVYAGARTTALSGAGRAGLSYPAPAVEELFNGRVAVYGLRETAAERTNLALENAGTSGPIDLRVTLMSGAGDTRFVLPDAVALATGPVVPDRVRPQGGRVFERLGARRARVQNNPFYAYGVVERQPHERRRVPCRGLNHAGALGSGRSGDRRDGVPTAPSSCSRTPAARLRR